MNNDNEKFGITYVIEEIRRELREISAAIKDTGLDTKKIRLELSQLDTRVNLLETMLNKREEKDEKVADRASDLRFRLLERVIWVLAIAAVAFGKQIVDFLV